jgi:hypothetical protein
VTVRSDRGWALDMPEGRQLEGAAGPSDGLGGKWLSVLHPASPVVGGDIPPSNAARTSFHVQASGQWREGGVKEADPRVKKV